MPGDRQPPRSRQLWLVPTEGQTGRQLVAEVAVNAPTRQLHTYAVPDAWSQTIGPGAAVSVPYGRGGRIVAGLCLRVTEQPWDHTRRPIVAVQPGTPWLSASLVELGLWVSDYYACSPWRTFTALLPAALRTARTKSVTYVRATSTAPPGKLSAQQAALLAVLGDSELRQADALTRAAVSLSTLRTLRKRGLVECMTRAEPVLRTVAAPADRLQPCPEDAYDLTTGQSEAVRQLLAAFDQPDPFRVFLLFGVPGSGKTEVYVRVMREVVRRGRQATLLIPEIALTTQIVERLARRFQRVAVLHSQLPDRVRRETLAAIAAGEVDVVIGTRTAVFAPCPKLGLLVVDEEQETSFKNLAAPFYHARDVAIKRGQLEHVPVVLGSATPALETWHNAQQRPHFQLVRLPQRVPGARLPEVRLVEAGRVHLEPGHSLLSPELHDELAGTLAAGQQAILLYNRRGYAVYLRCSRCGLMLRCESCGGHLVYHQAERLLKCHRCAVRKEPPPRCLDRQCDGHWQQTGLAIQRLEEDLHAAFPQAKLLRLDSDTMRRREDYQAALHRFENGEADILLGTQMVAKGLDFPRVRLVGVIEADAALSLPDFRAAERVFQLIVQVVGRAGRREGSSLALVQAAERPPPVIGHALRLDYEAFAAEELEQRRRLAFPPWTRLVRLVLADPRPHRAREEAERLATALRQRAGRIHAALRVDPPEACVIKRRRELLRYQVLLRGPQSASVQRLIEEAGREKELAPRVKRFTIDVDPVDLL
jgi:primosomal protein N' (replication factor Y)